MGGQQDGDVRVVVPAHPCAVERPLGPRRRQELGGGGAQHGERLGREWAEAVWVCDGGDGCRDAGGRVAVHVAGGVAGDLQLLPVLRDGVHACPPASSSARLPACRCTQRTGGSGGGGGTGGLVEHDGHAGDGRPLVGRQA